MLVERFKFHDFSNSKKIWVLSFETMLLFAHSEIYSPVQKKSYLALKILSDLQFLVRDRYTFRSRIIRRGKQTLEFSYKARIRDREMRLELHLVCVLYKCVNICASSELAGARSIWCGVSKFSFDTLNARIVSCDSWPLARTVFSSWISTIFHPSYNIHLYIDANHTNAHSHTHINPYKVEWNSDNQSHESQYFYVYSFHAPYSNLNLCSRQEVHQGYCTFIRREDSVSRAIRYAIPICRTDLLTQQ